MKKTIAITGASGYIGSMLLERLAARPEVGKVLALDVRPPGYLPANCEYARIDVRDPRIGKRLEGVDAVVHLAFIVSAIHDRDLIHDVNVNGNRNLLAAIEGSGVDKLVAASSVAAYGRLPRDNSIIDEDTPLRGESSSYYMLTKRMMEEDLDVFEKRNPGVIVTRLRPSILMGKGTRSFAREMGKLRFAPRIREGLYLPVVHEEDAVDAFELAVERDAPGAFIISLPEPMTLEEIVEGRGVPIRSFNRSTVLGASRIMFPLRLTRLSPDWIACADTRWRFEVSRARNALGWEPKRDKEKIVSDIWDNIEGKPRWRRWMGG